MFYEEFAPPEAIRDHVSSTWTFRGPNEGTEPVIHTVPPDRCMGIAVALRAGRLPPTPDPAAARAGRPAPPARQVQPLVRRRPCALQCMT